MRVCSRLDALALAEEISARLGAVVLFSSVLVCLVCLFMLDTDIEQQSSRSVSEREVRVEPVVVPSVRPTGVDLSGSEDGDINFEAVADGLLLAGSSRGEEFGAGISGRGEWSAPVYISRRG